MSTLVESAELLRTAVFAAEAHKNQRRKDANQTPYINHPLGVAELAAREGQMTDLATLQACLLHDTIEDTAVTYDDLLRHFGREVADLVAEVTDDKSLAKQERKQRQIEHAAQASAKAQIVKLADKLYNLRNLLRAAPANWSIERVQAYFGWSSEVIAGCRSASAGLAAALDEVLASRLTGADGSEVPCMPPNYQPGDWRKNTPVADVE